MEPTRIDEEQPTVQELAYQELNNMYWNEYYETKATSREDIE